MCNSPQTRLEELVDLASTLMLGMAASLPCSAGHASYRYFRFRARDPPHPCKSLHSPSRPGPQRNALGKNFRTSEV
ncbi:uncharacterized protein K441DRAFT_668395 [Cenococcum geophilum 1.58]|uniref:uncharacterized protein n=1 Tax=Cenococcum geophilum 1.58 TaxID=794803 RepID=UPI00358DFF2D|nr:hypothetical protein K441DRAFT_668395 [Cenococcum geophilum 1.58]